MKTIKLGVSETTAKKAILIKGISDMICQERPKVRGYDRYVYSQVSKHLKNKTKIDAKEIDRIAELVPQPPPVSRFRNASKDIDFSPQKRSASVEQPDYTKQHAAADNLQNKFVRQKATKLNYNSLPMISMNLKPSSRFADFEDLQAVKESKHIIRHSVDAGPTY
jgi:hypothetical protein